MDQGRQGLSGRRLVCDLGGVGVDRVHLDRHGQPHHIPVVQNAAPGSHFEGALLLLLRAFYKLLMAHHLQPIKTPADGPKPSQE